MAYDILDPEESEPADSAPDVTSWDTDLDGLTGATSWAGVLGELQETASAGASSKSGKDGWDGDRPGTGIVGSPDRIMESSVLSIVVDE